jgi:hypothetical protein
MRRPAHFLCLITCLACAAVFLPPPAAKGQQEPQTGASPETDAETGPAVAIGEDQGTNEQRKETEGGSVPADPVAPTKAVPVWRPPDPNPKDHDWIQLTSGEWLKGKLLQMRDGDLEFDSEELENLSFDWEDIAELRSPHRYTYVFADRTTVIGAAVISNEKVVIGVDGGERILARADLMSIVPAADRERDRWNGTASIGLAFRRGNTEQTDLTYQGYIRRQTKLSRGRLDYNGNLGIIDGEETSNNHRGLLKGDIFLSPRFYVTPGAIEVFHDALQNIELRLTPSAGLGYHALMRKKISLDLELAGGYQITRYLSVAPGEEGQTGRGAVIPTLRLEADPLRRVELDALYTAQLSGDNGKDSTQHGELILSIELTKVFDVDVSWIWDRVQNPSPNEDGSIPKKDDLKLSVGIGIDF